MRVTIKTEQMQRMKSINNELKYLYSGVINLWKNLYSDKKIRQQ